MSTADLIEGARNDEQAAWDALVDRYTRLVWHVVLGFSQLDSQTHDDVHQTVWLRLAENLDRINKPDSLGSWLATTARNECTRLLKTRTRESPRAVIDLEPSYDSLDRHLLETERDAALWSAFEELGESCQQLLRLLIAEPPFSYDEIAVLLEMKRGSIGPTRQRCLEALGKKLSGTIRDERT